MVSIRRVTARPALARLRAHLSSPLHRNGYMLVVNSLMTSGLGLAYWVLAARIYPPSVVGVNAAALAAMTLLATVSQFALVNALVRFVPTSGRYTARLIILSYTAAAAVSALTSLGFVLGVGLWSPGLSILHSSPWIALWFVLSTAAWSVFILQDGVLTGMRQTHWVPVENASFSAVKIILLVPLAAALPGLGILFSWTIPTLAFIAIVNLIIFWRFVPRHVEASKHLPRPVASHVFQYLVGDGIAVMVWMVAVNTMPLIVLERLGATANAHFYLAWTIGYTLYLVNAGMSTSLTAEGAREPGKLGEYAYRVAVSAGRLVLPAALVLIVAAPLVLRLFGADYARDGSMLLRLIALSALPDLVILVYTSVARVQRRMRFIVFTYLAQCSIAVLLSWVLLNPLGITGVGLGWLIGSTAVAVFLMATRLDRQALRLRPRRS